jgi:hypothetical protein
LSAWPDARPPRDRAARRDARLGWAVGLFLVALAAGGLSFGLLHEEGLVALSGQRAVAQVDYCQTGRHASCFAVVRTLTGETLDTDAEIPNSGASKGDEIRVRYRAGKAVPDGFSGRFMPLLLVAVFAVWSAVTLVGAIASALGLGRGRRPRRRGAEPGVAGPGAAPEGSGGHR